MYIDDNSHHQHDDAGLLTYSLNKLSSVGSLKALGTFLISLVARLTLLVINPDPGSLFTYKNSH